MDLTSSSALIDATLPDRPRRTRGRRRICGCGRRVCTVRVLLGVLVAVRKRSEENVDEDAGVNRGVDRGGRGDGDGEGNEVGEEKREDDERFTDRLLGNDCSGCATCLDSGDLYGVSVSDTGAEVLDTKGVDTAADVAAD